MRIASLVMDAQDKTRFEIQGKSSVKYHLKANHVVEAKRWVWALNNAIQWAKDEAKGSEQKRNRDAEGARQAKSEQTGFDNSKHGGKGLIPATAVGMTSNNASLLSLEGSTTGPGNQTEIQEPGYVFYEPSIGNNGLTRIVSAANTMTIAGDLDDDEEYGDDASSHDIKPAPKDAFNITANSAKLQLDLLGQVSAALQTEISQRPATPISEPTISQAISTYEGAVQSLQNMVADLLKIARDREAYWQYRVDREADMRRLWEDSMTKVAKEQEVLESRIGESEEKRKRTKRALRDVLDVSPGVLSPSDNHGLPEEGNQMFGIPDQVSPNLEGPFSSRRKSLGGRTRRKSTITALADLSDSDTEADEEFFDAVDAGEVEIVDAMPSSTSSVLASSSAVKPSQKAEEENKGLDITSAFRGYEEPVRKRLGMDADDRPKISLWVSTVRI